MSIRIVYDTKRIFHNQTGFRILILKAKNHKHPILIGSLGVAAEVAGSHAHIAYPFDAASIVTGIDAILNETQANLDDAYAHAQLFSWKNI